MARHCHKADLDTDELYWSSLTKWPYCMHATVIPALFRCLVSGEDYKKKKKKKTYTCSHSNRVKNFP